MCRAAFRYGRKTWEFWGAEERRRLGLRSTCHCDLSIRMQIGYLFVFLYFISAGLLFNHRVV